eukprot:CAMPEP_0178373518 /NCGR_PEP_ID=MMETSP0689_2-20121128/1903_1 /TAXON_ID=160604 /ORGANISM="Amphidinium massartii, Strain CS-259" /LENGTH=88 /DNA_ID=CAMNT_0019993461 /DNA_START=127 /DNA_END=394 /DNA_ORIENTATION=+
MISLGFEASLHPGRSAESGHIDGVEGQELGLGDSTSRYGLVLKQLWNRCSYPLLTEVPRHVTMLTEERMANYSSILYDWRVEERLRSP